MYNNNQYIKQMTKSELLVYTLSYLSRTLLKTINIDNRSINIDKCGEILNVLMSMVGESNDSLFINDYYLEFQMVLSDLSSLGDEMLFKRVINSKIDEISTLINGVSK